MSNLQRKGATIIPTKKIIFNVVRIKEKGRKM
jgi:hypothetical protein